jgi:hypothetical protein
MITSNSNRTLSRKSLVVFIGFQPNFALPLSALLSALQRELVTPRQTELQNNIRPLDTISRLHLSQFRGHSGVSQLLGHDAI